MFPTLCMAFGGGGRYDDASLPGHQKDSLAAVRRADSAGRLIHPDSLSAENERFYDRLAVKSNRKGFTRMLHNLFVKSSGGVSNKEPMAVTDETALYRPFEGRTVRSIEIVTNDIYADKPVSFLEGVMNAVHVTTRRHTINRDMLFERGDKLDPDRVVKNKQLLTSRDYLYAVDIVVTPVPDDSLGVDVKVVTHDRWTINVDGAGKGSWGIAGDIYDVNLLGSGNKFRYSISLDWRKRRYEGSMFEYSIPNILGTFFNGRFVAGRSFWDTQYLVEINKRLVVDNDYEAGFVFNNLRTQYYVMYVDPERFDFREPVKSASLDVWLGKSLHFPSIRSNVYGMAAWYGARFYDRPDYTVKGMNPVFQTRSLWLGSLGLYREKFLTTNMTYSYGDTEYLATGYKAEITGGYLSGEFDSGAYAGASFRMGDFTPAGYFMGDMSIGGFYDAGARGFFQSALSLKVDYVTNLLKTPHANLRQFISLNYVKGWNRAEGAEEWIRLTKESGPRGLPGFTHGRERAVLKTETVVFTPWQPLDFRIALYGYLDAGLICDNRNLFRNDLYSTIGIGIRLNNERLAFGTLQLNLSVALNRRGLMNNNWIMINDGTRMRSGRYIPEQPRVVGYR